MTVWFNDIDPFVCAWLRELFPEAVVDERDFREIDDDEFTRHNRAHWFAGIGGWEYALRLAGWPEDRPRRAARPPRHPPD